MKIEQIEYILAVYKMGSISKAAKQFYMSRPNLSNSIRNLENELGFEIMERGTDGVKFTKKGEILIRHCTSVLKELKEIRGLADEVSRLQFGIVNPNCPPVEDAFIRLCRLADEKKSEYARYQLSIYREYQYEGMRLLNQKKADVAVTVSNNMGAPSIQRELEERGLEYRKLWNVPCNVNLSENHPLAKDPDFQFEKLREYPFVEYAIEGDRGSPYNRIAEVSFVNLSKIIRVDSGNMRTHVIANSNAYSVGIAMPPEWAKMHRLCCIPIPRFTMELGYMRRAGEPVSAAEEKFMEYLAEEMAFLGEV